MNKILVKGGRLVDPKNNIDELMDVLVVDGKVQEVGKNIDISDCEIIDASGKVVAPGLIDIHCHLRVPGLTYREDFRTASRGAAIGGFTTLTPLPNTKPVVDNEMVYQYCVNEAKKNSIVNILPVGSITIGEEGKELSPMVALAKCGSPLFSDDGMPVANADLMRRALQYSVLTGRALSVHCEDKGITGDGVMTEGARALKIGLRGMPSSAETTMVARDIVLAKETGGHVHIDHVGWANTVDVIRFGKAWGANVTAETTVHYFTLTEDDIVPYDANFKINPPLPTARDAEGIKQGLKDGTIDCIVTDHAPYSPEEKSAGFQNAPFGLIGLETTLSLVISQLVKPGVLTLSEAIAKMTSNPAKILVGVDKGHLSVGAVADLIVIDMDKEWVADVNKYQSKSRNCPYHGRKMTGKCMLTMVGGKVIMKDGEIL